MAMIPLEDPGPGRPPLEPRGLATDGCGRTAGR